MFAQSIKASNVFQENSKHFTKKWQKLPNKNINAKNASFSNYCPM
jgi:hypothetical protein